MILILARTVLSRLLLRDRGALRGEGAHLSALHARQRVHAGALQRNQ
jgi:hypothetical protein